MNDITYTFNQTNKERKNLAASSMHRVNGCKSHKCSFPSDSLTAAQKRQLSGPVHTYNLSAPMTWAVFKSMPKDLQEEYIVGLRDRFDIGTCTISESLFGLQKETLYRHIERNNLRVSSHKGRSAYASIDSFREWVCNSSRDCPDLFTNTTESVEPVSSVITDNPTIRSALTSVTLRLSGERDAMLEAISSVIGSSTVELEVTINFKEENK